MSKGPFLRDAGHLVYSSLIIWVQAGHNKWSNIGFGKEIAQVGSSEVNFMHLIWISEFHINLQPYCIAIQKYIKYILSLHNQTLSCDNSFESYRRVERMVTSQGFLKKHYSVEYFNQS